MEEAAEIFLLTFPSVSRVFPLPKECVAVPRQSITCHVCKTDLYRMSPNYCDKCWAAYFKPVQDLIKQEELEKIAEAKAKAAKKKKKGLKPDEDEGNDNAGMLNPNEAKKTTRSWRPPKAPKVRQTWKKGKK